MSAEETYLLDRFSRVIRPNLRDATFVGIDVRQDSLASLRLRQDEDEYEIRLEGLERLRADDSREGNIVLEVFVESGPDCDQRSLYRLLDGDPDRPRASPWVRQVLLRMAGEKLVLFRIESSYGCDLTALCRRVTVDEVTD